MMVRCDPWLEGAEEAPVVDHWLPPSFLSAILALQQHQVYRSQSSVQNIILALEECVKLSIVYQSFLANNICFCI